MNSRRLLLARLGLLVGLAPAAPAASLPTDWRDPVSGAWDDSARWSAGLPTADTPETTVAGPGSRTVTVSPTTPDAALALQRMVLGGGGGTSILRLDHLGPRGLTLTESLNVFAGGRLEIAASRLEFDGTLSGGGFHLNEGELLLDDGTWRVTGAVTRIGRTGRASATVLAGTFDARGEVLVGDQPGSAGTLLLAGGTATVAGSLVLADDPGARGQVTLRGATLAVTGESLRIGDDGDGRLDLESGTVSAPGVSVGRGPGASGSLRITGGTFRSGTLSLGRFAGATGEADISGGVLDLGSESLYVGREGSGTFAVSGGEITAAALVAAAVPGARATVTVSGGRLRLGTLRAETPDSDFHLAGGELEVGAAQIRNGRPLVVGDGVRPAVLRLGPGLHVFADGLIIEAGARLEGTGTLEGPLTVRGTDARPNGTTPPMPPAPVLRLVVEATGLEVEFLSDAAGTYQLEVREASPAGPWTAVGAPARGTGTLLRLPFPQGPSARLARVRTDRP